ncbi:hypothetical protein RUND412_007898, partial [Rhizina undulata]
MLFNRKAALAWSLLEIGWIKESIKPPNLIRTIVHQPWKELPFRLPKKLIPKEVRIVREKLDA